MGKKPIIFLILFSLIMLVIAWNVNNDKGSFDDETFIRQSSPRNLLSPSDSKSIYYEGNSNIIISSEEHELHLSSPVSATGSMRPTIPDHSKIITRAVTDDEDLFVGDIVCFWNKVLTATQICHRIIEIDGDRIFTRGDNVAGGGEMRTRDEINSIVVGVLF